MISVKENQLEKSRWTNTGKRMETSSGAWRGGEWDVGCQSEWEIEWRLERRVRV